MEKRSLLNHLILSPPDEPECHPLFSGLGGGGGGSGRLNTDALHTWVWKWALWALGLKQKHIFAWRHLAKIHSLSL